MAEVLDRGTWMAKISDLFTDTTYNPNFSDFNFQNEFNHLTLIPLFCLPHQSHLHP